ncbi:hypothetical protein A2W13_00875 [Candidatus Woesebacteria bacterium RBG_16_36_11]|uniref:DUF4015 domain-containing protein n=3 Tax=Candidatus Woeseibacteriota TaxID=1752722 RepID=A0A1F7X8A6_9BACT|nr:MAG: hypothetical protein A2Z67_00550 [Candidatus Woesebacteria bacterium RBG_13_36_22]OGM11266.1 MAG: hypothetical protein A2W13_00875 [Candidatus Woesebacteria bacterium RBG_16_36_11]OGM17524.1 MAG: hypothetical protein A2V55_02655 [Candidatus Woesebacteria bacterium RBG_19FT_COMBO_37_29]
MKKFNLTKILLLLAITSASIIILFEVTHPFLNTSKVGLVSTGNSYSVRLATNISNDGMVAVLNKYAKLDDVIEVRAGEIDKLNSVQNGSPLLIYGKNDDQTKAFSLAKEYGIKMIGYNLEDAQMTSDELVEKEKAAYTIAKENGLFFIFAPLAIHAEKYGADLAKNADAIAIQLRNYQLMENFTDKVKDIATNIRSSNPDIEIWVQLDVNARVQGNQNTRQSLSRQEIIEEINQIQDYVDLISIYYPRNDASVAQEVFAELRK